MAIKLFAHILRAATPDDERDDAAPSLDSRRRAFLDLVVRRVDLTAWGLAHPLPPGLDGVARREPATEPLWADTQPWYHEGSLRPAYRASREHRKRDGDPVD